MTKLFFRGAEIDPQNKVHKLASTVFDEDASELLGSAWADIVRHIWTIGLLVFVMAGCLYFYEHSKWGQQRKIRHMHKSEPEPWIVNSKGEVRIPEVEIPQESS